MTQTPNTSKLVSAAILFGDMKGSAALAEEDEDSTVQQLREYREFTRQTIAGFGAAFYKVKFEGDGFMAVFDTAHEMVACGFKLQQEFRRRGWLIRLGGAFGAVYRDEGGDVDGADVNRAARIQQGADAGSCEFLVSRTVEQIVRKRLKEVCFLPHASLEAKGIAEPLEVCAVAPATEKQAPQRVVTKAVAALPVPSPPVSRRWKPAALATIPLIAAGIFLWYITVPAPPPPPPPDPETVAVLEFENQKSDDDANGWYSRAIQTNLTTKLSDIEELEVVTLSFIVKKARAEGVDLLEAARRLRVGQVVTGSYAVDSDQIRIDASIIDTDKGMQKAAGSVKGARIDFFGLQDDLSETLCDKFNIQLTQAQKAKFETASLKSAKKSNTAKKSAVDKYRLLLEGEGVTSAPSKPETKAEPQAGISQGPSWIDGQMSTVLVPAALAQGARFATEEEIRQFLERYRSAYESGDIARLASLYVAFPETQLRSVEAYMSSVEDLHVELADVDIKISDNDAAVTYTRRDTFVDKETEEELSLEVRLTRFLARQGEELKFASAE